MMTNNTDPSLGKIATLGLCVVLPLLALLFSWGVFPAKMPASNNLFCVKNGSEPLQTH